MQPLVKAMGTGRIAHIPTSTIVTFKVRDQKNKTILTCFFLEMWPDSDK